MLGLGLLALRQATQARARPEDDWAMSRQSVNHQSVSQSVISHQSSVIRQSSVTSHQSSVSRQSVISQSSVRERRVMGLLTTLRQVLLGHQSSVNRQWTDNQSVVIKSSVISQSPISRPPPSQTDLVGSHAARAPLFPPPGAAPSSVSHQSVISQSPDSNQPSASHPPPS